MAVLVSGVCVGGEGGEWGGGSENTGRTPFFNKSAAKQKTPKKKNG